MARYIRKKLGQCRVLFSRNNEDTTIETHCVKEFEINELGSGLNKIYQKMDEIIVGQSEIKTDLAVFNERHKNTEKFMERIGKKLDALEAHQDSLDQRTRDLEEHVRNNTQSRNKVQAWIERLGFAAFAAYFGLDKFMDK